MDHPPPAYDLTVLKHIRCVLNQPEPPPLALLSGAAASGGCSSSAVGLRWRQSRRHSEERGRGELRCWAAVKHKPHQDWAQFTLDTISKSE